LLFDARLTPDQPVHGGIEFGFVGVTEIEQFPETAVKRIGMEASRGGEFGSGIGNAGDDHGENEIALAGRFGVKDGLETEFTERAENGGDVTVRAGTLDEESVRQGASGGSDNRFRVGQSAAESVNLLRAEMSDVGDGAGLDLAVFTEGFTEEKGGG